MGISDNIIEQLLEIYGSDKEEVDDTNTTVN
jgi:hypothetical protein